MSSTDHQPFGRGGKKTATETKKQENNEKFMKTFTND
jgi:hypothetical protein